MEKIKLFLLMTIIVLVNQLALVVIDTGVVFIFISIFIWVSSTIKLKEYAWTKKFILFAFIFILVIIGFIQTQNYNWLPEFWKYLPMLLFITTRILNLKFFREKIEKNNKNLIFICLIFLIAIFLIVTLLEISTENLSGTIFWDISGILSYLFFIIQMWKISNININLKVINLVISAFSIIVLVGINMISLQKISKNINLAENMLTTINSGQLTYNNIKSELSKYILDYSTDKNIYAEEVKNSIFIYQVRESEYNSAMYLYNSALNEISKSNFNKLLNWFQENTHLLERIISSNKETRNLIIFNISFSIIEILIICYFNLKQNG